MTQLVPDQDTLFAVLAAFSQVLSGAFCDPQDDFFAIGGDSLTGAICAHILRESGREVNLRDIFECKTAAKLATRMDGQDHREDCSS
jgi:hypothetical protein